MTAAEMHFTAPVDILSTMTSGPGKPRNYHEEQAEAARLQERQARATMARIEAMMLLKRIEPIIKRREGARKLSRIRKLLHAREVDARAREICGLPPKRRKPR
jgi:hypothetical protein